MLETTKHIKSLRDKNIIAVPIIKEYKIAHFEFIKNQKSYYRKKVYLTKSLKLIDWHCTYCESKLNGKTYKVKGIAEIVLRPYHKAGNDYKEFLKKNIFLLAEYGKHLCDVISIKNIAKYETAITEFAIDAEQLMAEFEVNHEQSIASITLTSGRNKLLNPRDIYMTAKTIFHIEQLKSVEDLYLRDLKPVVMFQIRQLLEVYGKRILGFYTITDINDNPIKKFTHISWEFLKYELKNEKPRVSFPFDFHTMTIILKWSNNFVHTTYLYSSHIQFFVLNTISQLFKPANKSVEIYNGSRYRSYGYADIRISNYDSLKSDFEAYLRKKSKNNNLKVNWMSENQVGAYIISL